MENKQWYDRQDLIPWLTFLAVLWLVDSVLRTGQLIKVVQGTVKNRRIKWLFPSRTVDLGISVNKYVENQNLCVH